MPDPIADTYIGSNVDEAAKVAFYMVMFHQRRARRVNFEQQWEESAALAWPEYRTSFFYGRDVAPGQRRTQFQVDSSVSIASHRFGAIADWLLTPSNILWAKCEDADDYLMRDRSIRQWYSDVTRILWNERYKGSANFIMQNQQNMQGLGVFGNMGMLIDELADYLDPDERGLRYLSLPVGEIYIETDHQRRVVGFIRHFRLTAQQHKTRFPKPAPQIQVIEAALMISSQQLFDVLQIVRPRTDYHPDFLLSNRGFKFESTYISVQGHRILEEGGYRTLPLAYGRYMVAPDEDYGRGPMQMVLAAAKTLNAQKRVYLKQGHRAGDPAYLVRDLIDLKTHSGAWNAGGMSSDGKPLVGILPTGQIQITKEMMDEEGETIKDAFLVNLFQMILGDKNNQMSPRQVLEYINERGVILYPTIGGQIPQYLHPMAERELDILSRQRKLPPMPPAMREAKAQRKMVFTNPVTRAMELQASAGYMRSVEFVGNLVKMGADAALFDMFEFDTSVPAMGAFDNSPIEWYSTPESLARKTKVRQQAEERSNQVKELPGRAAIIKAQAIQAKAQTGGNIGGALSGTSPTGMPGIPNQAGQIINNQGLGGSPLGGPTQQGAP